MPLSELQHRARGQWQEDFVTHQESWGWGSAATLGRDAQHKPDGDITQGGEGEAGAASHGIKRGGKATNKGKCKGKAQNQLLPALNKLSSSGGKQEGQIPVL